MKDKLPAFNTSAVAYRDSFYFEGPLFPVNINTENGLLANDFDLDGNTMSSLIIENPANGEIFLNNDGSFEYSPNFYFIGYDSLTYSIYDGYSLSKPNTVVFFVEQNETLAPICTRIWDINLNPNPCTNLLNIESAFEIAYIQVFDMKGRLIQEEMINTKKHQINTTFYESGTYVLIAKVNNLIVSKKFVRR